MKNTMNIETLIQEMDRALFFSITRKDAETRLKFGTYFEAYCSLFDHWNFDEPVISTDEDLLSTYVLSDEEAKSAGLLESDRRPLHVLLIVNPFSKEAITTIEIPVYNDDYGQQCVMHYNGKFVGAGAYNMRYDAEFQFYVMIELRTKWYNEKSKEYKDIVAKRATKVDND